MSDLQTGKKESPTPDTFENTIAAANCQVKTLVSDNVIFENMNHFEVYSHCVVFKKRQKETSKFPRDRKKRSCIKSFSKQARFRLFQLLAKIDNNLEHQPLFVTLTYHYGHLNNPKSTKNELHNFLVQLRDFDSNVQFIWRIELQKRGAPHYHLIIFPSDHIINYHSGKYIQTIKNIWHNIADPKSLKHKEFGCIVKGVSSYMEACNYLSKYIAKIPGENEPVLSGKHYGNSRNLPVKLHKRVGHWDIESSALIKKLLKWMRENGKSKYADEDYINVHGDFTIFIDQADFIKMVDFDEYFYRDY